MILSFFEMRVHQTESINTWDHLHFSVICLANGSTSIRKPASRPLLRLLYFNLQVYRVNTAAFRDLAFSCIWMWITGNILAHSSSHGDVFFKKRLFLREGFMHNLNDTCGSDKWTSQGRTPKCTHSWLQCMWLTPSPFSELGLNKPLRAGLDLFCIPSSVLWRSKAYRVITWMITMDDILHHVIISVVALLP